MSSVKSDLVARNFGIDLARTFAILMVILVHTAGIGFGRFGVQLFFVISGYLLGEYYLQKSIFEFIIHRAFRLFPLAIIFILIFYVKDLNNKKDLMLNLTLLQNFFWNSNQFPGGWSISCEWIFSIFLFFFPPKRKNRIWIIFGISVALQFISGFYIHSIGGVNSTDPINVYNFRTWVNMQNPFINLGFFLSGILILKYSKSVQKINKYAIIFLLILMHFEEQLVGHLMIGWQLAIPGLFVLCLRANTKNSILTKVINFIGKRTYGTFFVHFLVWRNLKLFFTDEQYHFIFENRFGNYIEFIVVFLISLIGGAVTYKYIEKPFLSLHRKLRR